MTPILPVGLRYTAYHHRVYEPGRSGSYRRLAARGGDTTVNVFDESGKIVSTGRAKCHPEDNYNKKVGRDLALARALAALDRPRDFSKLEFFWQSLHPTVLAYVDRFLSDSGLTRDDVLDAEYDSTRDSEGLAVTVNLRLRSSAKVHVRLFGE